MDTRKIACLGAAAFIGSMLVGAVASPAHSQSQPVTVVANPPPLTRAVPYGDLALATPRGRSMLVHRVTKAVHEVCPAEGDFGVQLDVYGCEHFAWAGARPQMRRAFDMALQGTFIAGAVEVSSAMGK